MLVTLYAGPGRGYLERFQKLGFSSSLFLSYSMMEYYASSGPPPPSAGPVIPSAQTAFASPPATPHPGPITSALQYPLPPLPPPGPVLASPPEGPPPPPAPPVPPHPVALRKGQRLTLQPVTDARSDLLSAIRMGKWSVVGIFCIHQQVSVVHGGIL